MVVNRLISFPPTELFLQTNTVEMLIFIKSSRKIESNSFSYIEVRMIHVQGSTNLILACTDFCACTMVLHALAHTKLCT